MLAPLGGIKGGMLACAVAGSGDAKDDVTSQLTGVGVGTIAGGVLGGVLKTVGGRVGRDGVAAKLSDALNSEASTTSAAVAAARPAALADVLPSLTRAVRAAAAGPAKIVNDALAARGARQIPIIQQALEDGLDITRGDASAARDVLVSTRAAAARPLYEAAYAGPNVSHPEIESAMELPAFKQAYAKAQALAAIEGAPLPAQVNDVGARAGSPQTRIERRYQIRYARRHHRTRRGESSQRASQSRAGRSRRRESLECTDSAKTNRAYSRRSA